MTDHEFDAPMPALTVLYNGACPLCRREVRVYRGLEPGTPVCFADVSDVAQPLRYARVNRAAGVAAGRATSRG